MRAVCDFTKVFQLEAQGDSFDYSACFLPLMGKPFIQHILEYIERLGINEWDMYLSNEADEMEQFIGDGERWGVKLTYHLVKSDANITQRIQGDLQSLGDELFLFCNDLFLPFITADDISTEMSFFTISGLDTHWKVCTLSSLTLQTPSKKVDSLSVSSANDYLKSIENVYSRKGQGLVIYGKEIREGIWAGPGTKIPLSCTIVAPVYLGSQVRIGDSTIIGPFVEIGNGCIIDDNSLVKESSVLNGSFLGKNLDVNGCIVNQNRILNVQLGAIYRATDEMLFASVESREDLSSTVPVSLLSRLLALVLGLVTLPILLVLFLTSLLPSRKMVCETVVSFPQQLSSKVKTQKLCALKTRENTSGSIWKHLLWHLIPGFWLVVTKKARFFGIPYKSLDEFQNISKDWQELYLRSIPGIISEADILYSEYPDDQMLFASQMFYSVMASRKYNMTLLGTYIKRLFTGKIG